MGSGDLPEVTGTADYECWQQCLPIRNTHLENLHKGYAEVCEDEMRTFDTDGSDELWEVCIHCTFCNTAVYPSVALLHSLLLIVYLVPAGNCETNSDNS